MKVSEYIAQLLKTQCHVSAVFGVVGIPITELAEQCAKKGIKFISFRNEQSASYAASVFGFLDLENNGPGVCLSTSGPGLVHSLPGLVNAKYNQWPMILIAGASNRSDDGKGGFQEINQMDLVKGVVKETKRIEHPKEISSAILDLFKISMSPPYGPVYLELTADILNQSISQSFSEMETFTKYNFFHTLENETVDRLSNFLNFFISKSSYPLMVIGKGSAISKCEKDLSILVQQLQIPFLTTPMGKGVVSEHHPYCVNASRSEALAQADVVLLIGARTNWILNFGASPPWNQNVIFAQMDHNFKELQKNESLFQHYIPLKGHLPLLLKEFNTMWQKLATSHSEFTFSFINRIQNWTSKLQQTCTQNKENLKSIALWSCHHWLSYHRVFYEIDKALEGQQCLFICEGSNTMDISRTMLYLDRPRSRLDAGTLGCMGIGLPYVIAASMTPTLNKRIFLFCGDSAFGFSGMELETISRYRFPVTIIVFNNHGIYQGLSEEQFNSIQKKDPFLIPVTALSPFCRYDLMAIAMGGSGYLVKTEKDLRDAIQECLNSFDNRFHLINCIIDPNPPITKKSLPLIKG